MKRMHFRSKNEIFVPSGTNVAYLTIVLLIIFFEKLRIAISVTNCYTSQSINIL